MPEPKEHHIAILIDYENISISFESKYKNGDRVDWGRVLEAAVPYGRVLIRRAYADWSQNVPAQIELLRHGFELINAPSKRGLKNAADIKMVIDAIDTFIVTVSPVTHVLLMTGDSDFTELVNYLRSRGIYVIGMGIEGSIAEYLIRACDKYEYFDRLHAPAAPEKQKLPGADVSEARRLLRQCMAASGAEEIDGSTLKNKILRLKPDFAESSYGYERFRDFLDAQPDIVAVRPHPTGGHLVVRKAANGEAAKASNIPDAIVDKYLAILRRTNIIVTPSENRPRILLEAFAVFEENILSSYLENRDRLCVLFAKKHPHVPLGQVLDTVYQIPQASCFDWELRHGKYPADTPLWHRRAKIKKTIKTPAELLAKVDAHLAAMIAGAVTPEPVDVPALSRILYGRSTPEVVAYIEGLLGKRPATPPPVPGGQANVRQNGPSPHDRLLTDSKLNAHVL